ncbi:hypothetical protein AB205_0040220 [Aquarana catesbeiana]|uniref:Eosinophil peroxidase n=1 Tax=Aquarana catesbeiana TaxID=8400 RepID=A0A2G9RR12_AQUCT|nr:hypothetical protein AB205_0040220 [Aquarana catesbeiana]
MSSRYCLLSFLLLLLFLWTQSKNFFPYFSQARAVSNQVVSYNNSLPTVDKDRSLMFMQWGQFLDHDTDLSPDTPARSGFFEGVDCETSCAQTHPCFPLPIPANDSRIKNQSDCIPLFRSAPVCNLVTPLREQINVLTSFVDGSQVYGSDLALATKLRNTTNNLGLLAVNRNYTDNGRSFLPFSGNNGDVCTMTNTSARIPCFLAGRSPFCLSAPRLTFRHWVRRMDFSSVKQAHAPTVSISGNNVQKITYKDWLPLLLGSEMSHVLPPHIGYNDEEDPRISNAFTIAFRMGHTLVHPVVYRLGDGYRPHPTNPAVPLHQTFFSTWRIVKEGKLAHYDNVTCQLVGGVQRQ